MRTEFQTIEYLKSTFDLSRVGDDCAVLHKDADTDLVITADMLVENVDFRLDWANAKQIGHKSLAVSLSDIAAMGAVPKWAMLSIAVPERLWDTGFLDDLYYGWHVLARQFGVELVGGDISSSPDLLVIDSIAGGETPNGKAILRSGAKAGDAIYVSGALGGAAGGLALLEERRGDTAPDSELVKRQLQPHPQIELAKTLIQQGLVTSMIDISDGLSSDLRHICRASSVGARIDADQVPIYPGLVTTFGSNRSVDMALNGGEDFELLFTAASGFVADEEFGITKIGEISKNNGSIVIFKDGKPSELDPGGFRHF
ncbi:MAG: thiamine-phosphate kinase [Pyrinomonadaceae bacterium]|nr:thiamine-phosphate kinase [Pyrinomonadaceae bacterium]